eukprot:s2686_g7.t1
MNSMVICLVGTALLSLLSTGNFVFLTRVYQQPVRESDTEGRAYGADGWQASAVAPCRYLDIIFALPFLVQWSQRLLCTAHIREYLLSSVHLADLLAWLPSYFLCISLLLHGSCQESSRAANDKLTTAGSSSQRAFHGMCMFRWIKLDSFFGGMFEQLRQVLRENYVIFRTLSACTRCHAPFVCMCPERITFILATALWISGSVLMYYAERDNPDEGTRDHFRTLFLSFWMTGLDFTSEAPVNDHSAQGKAVHTLIMLVGVGVFTVPMGVFGAAFRERLDEMHAQLLMSRPNAPRKSTEVRRGDVHDVACLEDLQGRRFLHPTGAADLLVMAGGPARRSLPITLAYLGGFSVSYRLRNFAVTLRLWRLAALERYVPAFGDFLEVLAGRGYQMLQVCYVLTSFWFILAASFDCSLGRVAEKNFQRTNISGKFFLLEHEHCKAHRQAGKRAASAAGFSGAAIVPAASCQGVMVGHGQCSELDGLQDALPRGCDMGLSNLSNLTHSLLHTATP